LDNYVLETRRLNLFYGPFQALKDIDFTVLPNTITALIGPSGCGKSTLIRCFNRMNEFIEGVRMEGEVYVKGMDVRGMDVIELRKTVGMVFQRPNPFPFSIYENMAYGLRIHGLYKKKRAEEVIERCLRAVDLFDALKDKLSRPALELPLEMQQRLCIARILTIEPEIILLDEPCSALDPLATLRIEELLIELKRRYTILIVTHNMQQASRISDYTGFLYLGELVEFGPTERIFTVPKDKRTEAYITGRFG